MPIPNALEFALPLLRLIDDRPKGRALAEATNLLADRFELTEDERTLALASGGAVHVHRIAWARILLKKAGLIESTRSGRDRITERGRAFLETNPSALAEQDLSQYPEFAAFLRRERPAVDSGDGSGASGETLSVLAESPRETFQHAQARLRRHLADEMLEILRTCPSDRFWKIVQYDVCNVLFKTLLKGTSGFQLQISRPKSPVDRPAVRSFGRGVPSHVPVVFITGATFTEDARAFAAEYLGRIVLIDGPTLAELMIDNGLGVATEATCEIQRIDPAYFA